MSRGYGSLSAVREEGRDDATRAMLLAILDKRGLTPSSAQQDRVRAERDHTVLQDWVLR